MIELRAVPGKTGRLLTSLLIEKRVPINVAGERPSAIISYGVRIKDDTIPVLNANAGKLNKYQELMQLKARGVPTIPHNSSPAGLELPMLGREIKHTKGRDIVMFPTRIPTHYDSDFFTQYIPQIHEFRVWAYRGRCLGVYQKILVYPWKAKKRPGIAWNWRRGYAFKFFHDAPEALKQLGVDAVRALDLDFGAVDIIQAEKDKQYYVLEANSAPGTQGPRQGLTYLATKIERWVAKGFPKRSEWKKKKAA